MPDWISFLHFGELRRVGERAEHGRLVERIADDDALAASAASASTSASARRGTTIRVGAAHDWPTLRIAPSTPLGTRAREIGIGQEHVGRLAAELLRPRA
jgi:hypothetical protein